MHILIAIDDSPASLSMLRWISSHSEWFSAEQQVAVVHAQPPLPNGLRPLLSDEQVDVRRIAEAHDAFRAVRPVLEHLGIKAKYFQKEGVAARVILDEAAQWHAQLIVMGSHGRGSVGRLVLGSVVSRVLASAAVPVLVVPPSRDPS